MSQADMVVQVERVRDEEMFILSLHLQCLITTLWLVYIMSCQLPREVYWLSFGFCMPTCFASRVALPFAGIF